MDNKCFEIYSKEYDCGENEGLIGNFELIEQISDPERTDPWDNLFIALNTDTKEVCVVMAYEISGRFSGKGGIGYRVNPIKKLQYIEDRK